MITSQYPIGPDLERVYDELYVTIQDPHTLVTKLQERFPQLKASDTISSTAIVNDLIRKSDNGCVESKLKLGYIIFSQNTIINQQQIIFIVPPFKAMPKDKPCMDIFVKKVLESRKMKNLPLIFIKCLLVKVI